MTIAHLNLAGTPRPFCIVCDTPCGVAEALFTQSVLLPPTLGIQKPHACGSCMIRALLHSRRAAFGACAFHGVRGGAECWWCPRRACALYLTVSWEKSSRSRAAFWRCAWACSRVCKRSSVQASMYRRRRAPRLMPLSWSAGLVRRNTCRKRSSVCSIPRSVRDASRARAGRRCLGAPCPWLSSRALPCRAAP